MLVDMLRNLVPVDDAQYIVYPNTDLPMVEYFEVHEDSGKSTLDVFVKGAFLLEPPTTLAATASQQFRRFRLRELSPRGFKDSEYYKAWYRNCGYQDECGFVIPTSGEGFVNYCAGQNRNARQL